MSLISDSNQSVHEEGDKKTRNRKRRSSLSAQTISRPAKRSTSAYMHADARISDISNDVLSEICSYLDVSDFRRLRDTCGNPAAPFQRKLSAVMASVRRTSVSLQYPRTLFSPQTHNIRHFLASFTKLETLHIQSEDSVWDFTSVIPPTVTSVVTNCPLSRTSLSLMRRLDGLSHLVRLQVATLSSLPSDVALLAKHLPLLESLNLSAYDRVSASGSPFDLSGFKSLRHLGVASIDFGSILQSFFIFPPQLETLSLLTAASSVMTYVVRSANYTSSAWQNILKTLLGLEHLHSLVMSKIWYHEPDGEALVDGLLVRPHFKHLVLPDCREWIKNAETGKWHYLPDDIKTLNAPLDGIQPYEVLRPTLGVGKPVCHPLKVALRCYMEQNVEMARYVLRSAKISMCDYYRFSQTELPTFVLCDTLPDGRYVSCHWLGFALACTNQRGTMGYEDCTNAMINVLSTAFGTLIADGRSGGALGKQRLGRIMTLLYLVHATPASKRSKQRSQAICGLLCRYGFDEPKFLSRVNVQKCSYARAKLLPSDKSLNSKFIPPSPYLVSHILDGLVNGSLKPEKKSKPQPKGGVILARARV